MSAKRPVRRGQLISPFGVGALVDFPRDECLMTAGLDAWPFAGDKCPPEWVVSDERLQRRLSVSHFRLPPDFRTPGPGIVYPNQRVPFVRFPQWHLCPRWGGLMEKLPIFGGRQQCRCRPGLKCHGTPERRRPFLIPIRIVAACEKGHIEDFPFLEWVHEGHDPGEDHQLHYVPGRSSAALSGILIRCSCEESRTLGGAFDFDPRRGGALHRIDRDCGGGRPWLGEAPAEGDFDIDDLPESPYEDTGDEDVVYGNGRVTDDSVWDFIHNYPDSAVKFLYRKNLENKPLTPGEEDIYRRWEMRGMTRAKVRQFVLEVMGWKSLPDDFPHNIWRDLRDQIFELKERLAS